MHVFVAEQVGFGMVFDEMGTTTRIEERNRNKYGIKSQAAVTVWNEGQMSLLMCVGMLKIMF